MHLLERVPRDVRRIYILHQRGPRRLGSAAPPRGGSAGDLLGRVGRASPVGKGPGVGRILQDRVEGGCRGRLPKHVPRIQTRGLTPRELEAVPPKVPVHLRDRAEFQELVKDQPDPRLNAAVRIKDHTAFGRPDQAGGKLLTQLAALGLGQPARVQTQAQAVQLCLRHRSFQPEHEPVVEITGMVDPVRIPNQRIKQRAQFQESIPVGTVAGQAGHLIAHDDADLAQPNIRRQVLKAVAARSVLGRTALVVVDDDDLVPLPTQLKQPFLERSLVHGALGIPQHLFGAGLPEVNDPLALHVRRLDLRASVHFRPPP